MALKKIPTSVWKRKYLDWYSLHPTYTPSWLSVLQAKCAHHPSTLINRYCSLGYWLAGCVDVWHCQFGISPPIQDFQLFASLFKRENCNRTWSDFSTVWNWDSRQCLVMVGSTSWFARNRLSASRGKVAIRKSGSNVPLGSTWDSQCLCSWDSF